MTASPTPPDPEAQLLALRERLRAARAERGACPPWSELRDDHLPGGAGRAGRAERLAHQELCPYCSEHVKEWEKSFDKTSDALTAIEMGVARGVVAGAKKLATIGRRGDAPPAAEPPSFDPAAYAPLPAPVAPPPPTFLAPAVVPVAPPAPAPTPPPVRAPMPDPSPPQAAAPPRPARERPAPPPTPVAPAPRAKAPAMPGPIRLLVVEADDERTIPESVFLCAGVMGAEVASVLRIESLAGDPDLDAVCAIVLAGSRPATEWPETVRRAKDLAPGRPVVVLAPYDAEPSSGARRALGAQLLAAADPAERLLVALDSRLR